jgi:carbamate kinase
MKEKPGLAVVAIGGNALIRDRSHESIPNQYDMVCALAEDIAGMIEAGWKVVVTHGNGPQVGFILRRSELSIAEVPPVPMDYAGADIQGAVGLHVPQGAAQRVQTPSHQARARLRGDADAGRPQRSGVRQSHQADRLAHG